MKYCDNPNCNDGMIFNKKTRTFNECLICREGRMREVTLSKGVSSEGDSFSKELGFSREFFGLNFVPITVFGKTLYNELPRDMMKLLSESIEKLIGAISTGRVPKTSLMYYLGSRSDLEMVAYLLIASAHMAKLTYSEYITPMKLRGIRNSMTEYGLVSTADIVVCTFAPSIREDMTLMEELMKDRALRGKPTIFLIGNGTRINSALTRMCSDESMRLDLCLYAGIPNLGSKDTDNMKLKRINSVIKYGNDKLGVSTSLLELDDISYGNNTVESIPRVSHKDIWGN